jgi:hypothetical protein
MELRNIKFEELKTYLCDNYVFGFTASLRKHTIIYTFRRFFNKLELSLRVKVMCKTKYVMSVMHENKVYTDFDELKKLVEKK